VAGGVGRAGGAVNAIPAVLGLEPRPPGLRGQEVGAPRRLPPAVANDASVSVNASVACPPTCTGATAMVSPNKRNAFQSIDTIPRDLQHEGFKLRTRQALSGGMKETGWTRLHVADYLNVSPKTVDNWLF